MERSFNIDVAPLPCFRGTVLHLKRDVYLYFTPFFLVIRFSAT